MRAFNELDWSNYMHIKIQEIKKEINNLSKEYILGVDENEYMNYMYSKYELIELKVDFESENYGLPRKFNQQIQDRYSRDTHDFQEAFEFEILYSFSGSPDIFRISPSRKTVTGGEIKVNSTSNIVSLTFQMTKQDPHEFFIKKEEYRKRTFTNLDNANNDVKTWKNIYKPIIEQQFKEIKQKFLKENSFFEALKLTINPNTTKIFTAPTVVKREIPQPIKSANKNYSTEPIVSDYIYFDILDIIYESGKSMEKKPSLYKNKNEEDLRDQFLLILETRYEGATATGETFNSQGKTDILIKYQDGSNLFIAECKFWHGAKEFNDAINQLFDRYLTWRDSKVALMFFVKNKEMTKVNSIIKSEIEKHEYFIKSSGERGDTSFSFKFHLPQDSDKIIHLEVMTFHFDK